MKRYIIAIVSILLCATVLPSFAAEVNTSGLLKMERRTFDLINAHRASIGEAELVWNDGISAIARKHSERMADGDVKFGHGGFAKRVKQIKQTIPKLKRAGENVAYMTVRSRMPKEVTEGWLNSAGHRANIETRRYNVSGMGIAKIGRYYYFTQIFLQK